MDYEHANSLEWDLNQVGGRTRQSPEDDWEVVGGSKKQAKVRLPYSPAVPSSQSPIVKNQDRFAARRDRSYQRAVSRPSAGGTQRSQPPRPATQAPERAQHNQSHQAPSQVTRKFGKPRNQQTSVAKSVPSPSRQNQQNQVQKPRQQQASSKWTGQEVKRHNVKQQRSPPKMAAGSENLGERLVRKRKEAQGHIRIPIELASQDNGHFKIAKGHRTFILPQGKPCGNTSTDFGIWGDPKAVEATMKDIRAWIDEWQSSRKSNKPSKFSKVVSLTPGLRERAERHWEKEVKKHRYRQFPPPDKAFEAIGSFHWPVKDYKPEEILGSSYEALDPIRLECKCYVVFDKEQGLFRVMGRSDAVRTGLRRLRGTYLQVVARQVTPLELYLLHDADGERAGRSIVLKEYDGIRKISGEGSREVKPGFSPRAVDGEFEPSVSNEASVCRLVMSKLGKLHHYHGSIQMRVRLGTFLVTRYLKSPSGDYKIEDYKTMIRESAFHGEVTQELGDKAIEKAALATLRASDDFLSPHDHMTDHLSDVKPLYTAIFTFNDPNNAEAGDIRLTMTWQEATDATSTTPTYNSISKKWTRLDRDSGTPSSILDISLTELRTGMAWQFEVHAAQSIEESRLPTEFSDFGDTIDVEANASRKAANPSATELSFVVYRSSFACLKHLEQRLNYCFGMTDYTIELSRFQHRSFPARKGGMLSPTPEPTVYESRWGLSVHHNEWDTKFTRNERLPIGGKADWGDEEDVWFPPYYSLNDEKQSGFRQMMEKLKRIKMLLMEAGEDESIDGMKIG